MAELPLPAHDMGLSWESAMSVRLNVHPGEKIDLSEWATLTPPEYTGKDDYQAQLTQQVTELSDLQSRLYAANSHALLIIFQAMDAAGKDGAIQHVMSGVNPQGCQVFSFKHPSAVELAHDFLWRTTRELPERGRIGIFNRSYYEEVLIARVHPEILQAEAVTTHRHVWKKRYASINGLEQHLHGNGTRIIKFFLHISKEEQRRRFLDRIDTPEKNWKLSMADIEERTYWKDYMKAYEACLSATSSKHAAWHIIPADDKRNARLMVARVIVETLQGLDLAYPKPDAARLSELQDIRRQLMR